jgi:ribosomal protein S15P/S13E
VSTKITPDALLEEASVRGHAEELGVDPDLAAAVGSQESRFNPKAVSPKGARGTMQVMPTTSSSLVPRYGADPNRQGVGYLKDMLSGYEDVPEARRRHFALAAYNAGPGRVRQARRKAKAAGLDDTDFESIVAFLPEETRNYVPGVLGRISARQAHPTPEQGTAQQVTAEDLLGEAGVTSDSLLADAGASSAPAAQPRSFGDALYDRTIGRVGRAADAATGHLVSDTAAYLGAKSAGDEAGAGEAFSRHGDTKQRLKDMGLGLIELALTGAFPGLAAVQAGVGTAVETATGSETAGNVGELATGLAPAAAGLARGGASLLRGGKSLEKTIGTELGAGTTLQEAGKAMQAPKSGARGAITKTADEAGALYDQAASAGRAAGAKMPGTDRSILKAARQAQRDVKAMATTVPTSARRAVQQVVRLGRGQKSKVLGPTGQPASTARQPVGVDELLEAQSNLRREIGKLPKDHPAKPALLDLDSAIENSITRYSKGTAVESTLDTARRTYRETTIPTRKTASRIANAETPEQAARATVTPKQPTRFERIARVEPEAAEKARSSFWTDAINEAHTDGVFDLAKLSTRIPKDPKALAQMADTPARRTTVKALQLVTRQQKALGKVPWFGPLLRAAAKSERAANVLYRLAKARVGTPGWKLAAKAAQRIATSKTAGLTGRAAIGAAQDEED